MALTCCKTLSLNHKISYNSALSLANNGEICLSTDHGLFVLRFMNCPKNKDDDLAFEVVMIPTKDNVFEPDVGVLRDDVHKKFDYKHLDQMYDVMMDRTQSPDIQSSVSYKVFKLTRWSPGAGANGNSVLAALTFDHQLKVFEVGKIKYHQISDISEEFCKSMREANFTMINNRLPNNKSVMDKLRQRTYVVAAVDFTWSDIWSNHLGQKFSLMFILMKSGHLVIWKVSFPLIKTSFELLEMVDTGDVVPVCLECAPNQGDTCKVFVGYCNGTVRSFTATREGGTFELQESGVLWEDADDILVSHLIWLKEVNILLCAKGSYLIVLQLDLSKTYVSVTSQSYSLVSDTMPVTALCYRNGLIFVSTSDGNLCQCTVNTTDFNLKVDPVKITRANSNKWCSFGLGLTHNSVYLLEAASPLGVYDHLVLKDALRVNCIQLLQVDDAARILLQKEAEGCSLDQIQDVLMCLKCHFLQSGALPESVSHLCNDVRESWTNLSTTALKLTRYFLQVKHTVVNKTSKEEEKASLTEAIQLIQRFILHRHCCTQLKILAEKQDMDSLTDNDLTTLRLMCKFLRNSGHSRESHLQLVRNIETKHRLLVEGRIPDVLETCYICSSEISTTKVYGEGCPKGHIIGRCCQTFQICQDLPYRVCQNCQYLAVCTRIKGSSWFESLKTNRCTYCDGMAR